MKATYYLDHAKNAQSEGDLEEALDWLEKGLLKHPKNEELTLNKASILMQSYEDVDEAFLLLLGIEKSFGDESIEDLKKRLNPEILLELYLLLSECFRLKEDYREAFNHALMAQKISPKEEVAILAVATAYFELGQYEKAKVTLRLVQDDPSPESFWLLGHILSAEDSLTEADEMFSFAADGGYHQPVRVSQKDFINYFNQALLSLPEEIADLVHKNAVQIMDIIPLDMVLESQGKMSPRNCISIDAKQALIYIYQTNIENLVAKKSDLAETIASVIVHGLTRSKNL